MINHKELGFASLEEYQFSLFLEELRDFGYVDEIIYQPESFVLNKPLKQQKLVFKGRGKNKREEWVDTTPLIPVKHYTCDFKVKWANKAVGVISSGILYMDSKVNIKFYVDIKTNDFVSYFEVKPKFDQNNMTRLVKTNQAIVWDKYNIYVQIVIPEILFKETFLPTKYREYLEGEELRLGSKSKERTKLLSFRTFKEYMEGLK